MGTSNDKNCYAAKQFVCIINSEKWKCFFIVVLIYAYFHIKTILYKALKPQLNEWFHSWTLVIRLLKFTL